MLRLSILTLTLACIRLAAPPQSQSTTADHNPDVTIPKIDYGKNLKGLDVQGLLQAIAFGTAKYSTTFQTVTIVRTENAVTGAAESWIEINLESGEFKHINPDCPGKNGSGTITAEWAEDELHVALDGQMCSSFPDQYGRHQLCGINMAAILRTGAKPGEIEIRIGDESLFLNVGQILIETDALGIRIRPAAEPIQPIGKYNELVGMAAALVATVDGDMIRHPNWQPDESEEE